MLSFFLLEGVLDTVLDGVVSLLSTFVILSFGYVSHDNKNNTVDIIKHGIPKDRE